MWYLQTLDIAVSKNTLSKSSFFHNNSSKLSLLALLGGHPYPVIRLVHATSWFVWSTQRVDGACNYSSDGGNIGSVAQHNGTLWCKVNWHVRPGGTVERCGFYNGVSNGTRRDEVGRSATVDSGSMGDVGCGCWWTCCRWVGIATLASRGLGADGRGRRGRCWRCIRTGERHERPIRVVKRSGEGIQQVPLLDA